MSGALRYLRLYAQLARYTLVRELSFRGNFLVKVSVEVLWLGILLAFYRVVFSKTSVIAEWSEPQYLFFVGCYFAMNGLLETLFLENCNEFAELVRKGDLDFLLLRPIDEQFLITCRRVDWSTAPNVLMGVAVMGLSLVNLGWTFDPTRVAVFLLMFGCGVMLAYSFMVLLTATGVWLVRNQSMMELWWLFSSLTRYPREIYLRVTWAEPIGLFFTFIVPFLLVINVPAESMVKMLDWRLVSFTLLATAASLWVSRQFFRRALRSYRSASS
ncbi:ABC transporter permease [Tautonia rosea]|uniref:ABC transporter permease n=1 Tax=Tautonia rosea TaxID=2728037 RepID=UPI001473B85E|nr:ABC-2 family transporter protein [Tautonia rosea]